MQQSRSLSIEVLFPAEKLRMSHFCIWVLSENVGLTPKANGFADHYPY